MNDNFKYIQIDPMATESTRQTIQQMNYSAENDMLRMQKLNKEKHEREVKDSENLSKIADYNSEITEYNKQLVNLNNSILTKINSINTSLDFIFEAIEENTEITKEDSIEHKALLLELITIMESKDKNKIKGFLGGLPGNIATGLTVEYLKYKLGIS